MNSIAKSILYLAALLLITLLMSWGEEPSVQIMKLAASVLYIGVPVPQLTKRKIYQQNGQYLPYIQSSGRDAGLFSCWFTIMDWSPSTTVENSIFMFLSVISAFLIFDTILFFWRRLP
ncbi:hypothetical protein SD208_13510 [Ochrobactrum sp. BD67]